MYCYKLLLPQYIVGKITLFTLKKKTEFLLMRKYISYFVIYEETAVLLPRQQMVICY